MANLPYSISSLLVLKIIRSQLISQATIMVQKEMADRLCAKVGTHAYNMFTILVQLFLDVQKLFDVDPSNFSPKPKVQSCVIQLTKKQPVSDCTVTDLCRNYTWLPDHAFPCFYPLHYIILPFKSQ